MCSKLLGFFFNMEGLVWNCSSPDLTVGLLGVGVYQVESVRHGGKVALPLGFFSVQ